MERVADYVVRRLVAEGIRHIPMVTGRGNLYLSDAIAKNPLIAPIPVHHEQSAAFAAVAYSQYNCHLGACLVSTGCASTNTLTGVLNAWQDGVPMIFLSGQNWLKETVNYTHKPIRTYGSQETNIIPIVSPITKFAEMVKDANQIGVMMDEAIYYATHGVKGPVWLDIPVDVQNMRVEPEELERWTPPKLEEENVCEYVEKIAGFINMAERPIVLIGGGVRSANAIDELYAFIEKCNIPVCFSTSAADTFGSGNLMSIGAVAAIGGSRAGNFAVQNADLVVCIGCRLSPMTTGSQYEKFARSAKIVVADIDNLEHSKETVRIDYFAKVDAKVLLSNLLKSKIKTTNEFWVNRCLHWKNVFPKDEKLSEKKDEIDIYAIASELSKVLEDDAVVLSDAGIEELVVPSAIDYKKNQRCLHPASQGCMGVALPAAIGAHLASGHAVTVVVGDGSIMMNLQELQTISFNRMPVRVIVVNNNVYSVIRKRQKELFRTRLVGVDFDNGVSVPNFQKIAECFGFRYMQVSELKELGFSLANLQKFNEPVICEIFSTPDQEYLRTSAAFDLKRKYVNRPIEDLFPWMDRDTFVNEMIVEPIDL